MQDYDCKDYFIHFDIDHLIIDLSTKLSLWHIILVILSIGLFASVISTIYRFSRQKLFGDVKFIDTFFDAGANVNLLTNSCGIILKWMWIVVILDCFKSTKNHGVMGNYCSVIGSTIPLFLYLLIIKLVRRNSTISKTYCQIMKLKYGTRVHIFTICIALCFNFLISYITMIETVDYIDNLYLVQNGRWIVTIVFLLVVVFCTLISGTGGLLHLSYPFIVAILAICCTLIVKLPYPILDNIKTGETDKLYNILKCPIHSVDEINVYKNSSVYTIEKSYKIGSIMDSKLSAAFVNGIVIGLCSLVYLVLDQSMWLNVISTSPTKMSWSFLIAGFGYISILSSITFTLGLTYWSYSLIHQNFIEFANRQGNIVTLIADLLYKVWGQLLVVIVIIMTSFVTLSSQILSIASIVIYDIYIPFIAPCETYWCEPIESNLNLMRCMSTDSCINTVTDNGTDESQEKKLLNEYNKRCMLVKHVVILGSGIILLIFMVVHNMLDNIIEKMWIYKVGAILFSGVLMPLIFSLIWDGCSGIAFVISSITSSISSITVWICLSFIFSKVEQNSLLNNQFENLPYDNIFEKNKTIFTQHQFILLENKFFIYTNANEPILFSLLLSILLGSILCIFISLIHNKCKQSKKKVKNMTLFDLKNYQDVREPPLHYYQKVSLSDALERLRWKFYKMEKLKSVNFKSIAKIQVHIKNSYTLPNDCCTNYVEYMSVCVTITAIILLVVVFPIIAFFLQPYGVTLVAFKLIVSAIMVVVFLSCLMFIFFPLIGIVYNVVIACIHCCIPKKKISKSQLNCSKNCRSVDCQLGHQTNSSNFDEFQSLNLPEKKESHVKPIEKHQEHWKTFISIN